MLCALLNEVEGREIARMANRIAPEMRAARSLACAPEPGSAPVRKSEALGHRAKDGEADRIDAIISRSKSDMPLEETARETAGKQLAYFEKHRERMLYATFRAALLGNHFDRDWNARLKAAA